MKIKVALVVDVDLDVWANEYGSPDADTALTEALEDLGRAGWYLTGEKWTSLASVLSIRTTPAGKRS